MRTDTQLVFSDVLVTGKKKLIIDKTLYCTCNKQKILIFRKHIKHMRLQLIIRVAPMVAINVGLKESSWPRSEMHFFVNSIITCQHISYPVNAINIILFYFALSNK